MLKYLLLILMPSSILQWLLLIACGVGGWFLFSTRFETSKKSVETVNIWGGCVRCRAVLRTEKRSRRIG